MRAWWERKMLPSTLRIRAYDAAATLAEKAGAGSDERSFRLVADVFADAPAPFAPGWSPRVTDHDTELRKCAECGRHRIEGWCARGQWYCVNCWKNWEKEKN